MLSCIRMDEEYWVVWSSEVHIHAVWSVWNTRIIYIWCKLLASTMETPARLYCLRLQPQLEQNNVQPQERASAFGRWVDFHVSFWLKMQCRIWDCICCGVANAAGYNEERQLICFTDGFTPHYSSFAWSRVHCNLHERSGCIASWAPDDF